MNYNIGIGDMTTGIDKDGMDKYIENLRLNLLEEVQKTINDVTEIENVIKAGWQGVACENFLKNFATAREKICDDLSNEFEDVKNRLSELQANYFVQDENMVNIEN